MANERIRRAIAYIEDGGSDLAPLEAMGLNASEIHEVLALACWDDRTAALREALDHLRALRTDDEVRAGLRFPIVVIGPPVRPRVPRVAIAALVALSVLGAVVAARVVGRARPERSGVVAQAAPASAPPAQAAKGVEKKFPSRKRPAGRRETGR